MRTTLSIADNLLAEAKQLALERNVTLGEVIEDALRQTLRARVKAPSGKDLRPLKTFRGTGLQPGVNLNASAELLAVMEEP
jgi:hypothetical protein